MENNEIKDITPSEQKTLFMKLFASKLRQAKRSPLSFSQERIWSLTQLNENNTALNISNSMYILGVLNEAVLEKSLHEVVRRQEILRSIFLIENEKPVQVALPMFSFRLKIIELSMCLADQATLEQIMNTERKQPFDLSKDLPFRAVLLRLTQNKHILILIAHQIVIDGESWPIIIRELGSVYQALKKGTQPALPALSMQYADYAVWQRERLKGASYTLLNEFWRNKYQETIEPLQLPVDRLPTSQLAQVRADTTAYSYKFSIKTETFTKLKQFSQQEKASLFGALLTTFNCLLYMYTRQERFLIFTSVSAKNRPELKALIGLFSNLVPIQVKISQAQNLKQILESVHQEVNDVVAHQDLPFDKITAAIKLKIPDRSKNYNVLFQVMFTFRYVDPFDDNLGDIRLEPMEMALEKEFNFQLRLGMKEMTDHIEGNLTYNAGVYEENTIKQMIEYYLVLLETSLDAILLPISELPVFESIGRHRELLAEKRAFYTQDDQMTPYEAPRNEVETKLAALWQEILGAPQVGVYDNFFELGGHSLNATILRSRIQQTFQVEVPLRQIFQTPTIAGLAEYLANGAKGFYIPIPTAVQPESYPTGSYPASAAQKRLYILYQIDPANLSYNISSAFMVEGDLDRDRLLETFRKLIGRHESLRTSLEMINGEPVQRIHPVVDPRIRAFRIEEWDEDDVKSEDSNPRIQNPHLQKIIRAFIRPFDLKTPPLLRIGLLSIGAAKHLLLFDMPHIISDGTSLGILVKEFIEIYAEKDLPELRIQYKDYAVWQNEFLKSEILKRQKEYWLSCFQEEIPVLELPTDYPRPAVQSFTGTRIGFSVSATLTQKLKDLAAQTGGTLYMVLLAAYSALLFKYTSQEDIIIGSPIAGRQHPDLQNIIGMFVNTLAIRIYPEGNKCFREYLNEVKQNALLAYENQDYQFEELVENLNLRRDLSRNPLFDTMFVLQNMELGALEIPGLKITPYEFNSQFAKFDLTLTAVETGHGIHLKLEYCTALFKQDAMERLAGHFSNILERITENPELPLSAIDMFSDQERQQLLYEFNDTRAEYSKEKTIQELFMEQVERTPEHIAVVFGDQRLTYGALHHKSSQLAEILREQGIQPDSIVGIMLERCLEMMIGIMGILKAGAAYLPIDPGYPAERIKYMLKDSNAKVLLTLNKFIMEDESISGISQIDISAAQIYHKQVRAGKNNSNDQFKHSYVNGGAGERAHHPAYVIYTSGSTGKPKGVLIEQHSIINRLQWMQKRYPLSERDLILQKTPFTFDVSVWELFWWTLVGARVCFLIPGGEKDPAVITDTIENTGITIMHFVPSMLDLFLDYIESHEIREQLSSLKHVFASGEALNCHQVKRFNKLLNKVPGVKLHNLYGPTEATVDVSYYECSSGEILSRSLETIPIGKPIDNIRLYVTDSHLN
jgi:amino acid adenylation domain-containing protein